MKINKAGLELLKSFEGCKLRAYKDIVGVLTIGYGHACRDVYEGQVITQEEAEELLKDDLCIFEGGVDNLLTVKVSDNQFSAMVCIAYNIGLGNFSKSTLLKMVLSNDFYGAAKEFLRWDKAQGKRVPGLSRRRQAEKVLFES